VVPSLGWMDRILRARRAEVGRLTQSADHPCDRSRSFVLQERDRLALQLCRKHGRTDGKACGIIRANLTNLAVCALSAEAHPPLPSGVTWARHLSLSDPDVPLIRNEDRSLATVNVVTPCHSLLARVCFHRCTRSRPNPRS
jgi:hypothetical protein